MADPAKNKKKSRLLAALDSDEDVDEVANTTAELGLGVKRPPDSPDEGMSNKRRVTGYGLRHEDAAEDSMHNVRELLRSAPGASSSSGASPSRANGFRMHYDDESRLEVFDVGGPDQTRQMADFVTRAIDNASHGLTVQAAMKNLGLNDLRDVIPGMEVRLLPHQLIGVSWMVKQEKETQHRGGILADDMGLGKTIQMIATMALNMPEVDEDNRTTLIVVPSALLLQWKEEIEQKTNGVFDVHIHHGRDKLQSVGKLRKKDVIITSYQTLTNDCAAPLDLEPEEVPGWVLKNGGPLARNRWHRIVLDEAQFVRNRATRASKAVAILRAKYRWCLTGTPVTNTLADLYGLLRFGRFRPWNDWGDFDHYIARVQLEDAPLAGLRAQQILAPLLLRRTKNALIDGKPILNLPAKHIELVQLEFTPDERNLYEQFQRRAQIEINRYIRLGSVLKNHSQVLVLILRLRQLCCHPHLILSLADHLADAHDPARVQEREQEFARAAKLMGVRWAVDMKRRFLERVDLTSGEDDDEWEEGECPVCGEAFVNDNALLLSCGHEICFDCRMELASAPIAHNGIFGEADEETNVAREHEFENAAAKGLRPCPTCKIMTDLRPEHVFHSSAFRPTEKDVQARRDRAGKGRPGPLHAKSAPGRTQKPPAKVADTTRLPELSDSEDELPDRAALIRGMRAGGNAGGAPVKSANGGKDSGKGKSKGKGKERAVASDDDEVTGITMEDISGPVPPPTLEPSEAVIATWRRGGADVEPSTKMLALIGYLRDWEATGDKTICFSQWTSMLDLVDMLFGRYGIQSLRYDGTMDRSAREAVLARFRQPGGPRVILISTKCGGVGLNLTAANRIVNLDLSWNYATESQAYDRAHRLGQDKEVFVKRLVVSNTLEERMLTLQNTKTGLAEAALGEGSGIKLHKLSVKELKDLFGMSQNNDDPRQTRLPYGQ